MRSFRARGAPLPESTAARWAPRNARCTCVRINCSVRRGRRSVTRGAPVPESNRVEVFTQQHASRTCARIKRVDRRIEHSRCSNAHEPTLLPKSTCRSIHSSTRVALCFSLLRLADLRNRAKSSARWERKTRRGVRSSLVWISLVRAKIAQNLAKDQGVAVVAQALGVLRVKGVATCGIANGHRTQPLSRCTSLCAVDFVRFGRDSFSRR